MTEQHLPSMTTDEWAAAVVAADLLAGPAFAYRLITGEYDAAVHVATSGSLTDKARERLIKELHTAVSEAVNRALCTRPVTTA